MQGRGGAAPFERVGGTVRDRWAWGAAGFGGAGAPSSFPCACRASRGGALG